MMRLENSFILAPGVGKKTEEKLWRNGVTHWDHFPGNGVVNGSRGTTIESFLAKAEKNLAVGNAPFFAHHLPSGSHWRLYDDFSDGALFFDIETTGLDRSRNRVTTVTAHHQGETTTLIRGEDLTAENITDLFGDASIIVSFNGKRFDVPFLQHNFDVDLDTPHIDLYYLCKRLGFSGGLKQVEKDLGIDRDLEDISGREAVKLWKRYEQGDDEALETLVHYNRLDVENLEPLLGIVHRKLRQQVFEPHLTDR